MLLVSLVGGVREVSMTHPLEASLHVFSPPSRWPWEVIPISGLPSDIKQADQEAWPHPSSGTSLHVRKSCSRVEGFIPRGLACAGQLNTETMT